MATSKRVVRKVVRVANKNKAEKKKQPVKKDGRVRRANVVEPRDRDPLYPVENGSYIRIADPPVNCRSRYISIRATGFGISVQRARAKTLSKAQCDVEVNAAIARAESVQCVGRCTSGKICVKDRLALRGFGGPSYKVTFDRVTRKWTFRCRRYRSFRLFCRCE